MKDLVYGSEPADKPTADLNDRAADHVGRMTASHSLDGLTANNTHDGFEPGMKPGRNWLKNSYNAFGKRVFDVVLATVLLIIAFPAIVVLAFLVALDGANPFFSHKRVGLNGRLFGCLKIRTMVRDADKKLAEVLENDPVAAWEWRLSQKLSKDPRVTRLGRFLRWSSMDELPQLWNVIRGDMSLVGPRPVVPEELERYGADKAAYLSVRPGITGPWQASEGRNSISYEARVALDCAYVNSFSLLGDLRLVLLTAVRLIRKPSGV